MWVVPSHRLGPQAEQKGGNIHTERRYESQRGLVGKGASAGEEQALKSLVRVYELPNVKQLLNGGNGNGGLSTCPPLSLSILTVNTV